jgi:blue light- and temperature-responsive anti-repressor
VTPALPSYSYAFQPIVDMGTREVFSYEALVRGPAGESAFQVLSAVPPELKYTFDETSRVRAIEIAARIGLKKRLNLNMLPRSLYSSPTALSSVVEAAQRCGLPVENMILEVTESEAIDNHGELVRQLNDYRGQGLQMAIDDFGAGYSGLNLLADFQPDQVKIDLNLVRGIVRHGPRQAIVRAITQACMDLGIDVVAEGIETVGEYEWFAEQGVTLFQGYLFAKPGFECLPEVRYPTMSVMAT